MSIPNAYKQHRSAPIKGQDEPLFGKELDPPIFGASKFFYLLGLCVFLYAGLRILEYLEFYKNPNEIIQILKNVKFTYRGNLAFASTNIEPQAPSKAPADQPSSTQKTNAPEQNTNQPTPPQTPEQNKDLPQDPTKPTGAEKDDKSKTDQQEEPFFDPLSITSSDDVKILKTLGIRRKEIDEREKAVQKKEADMVAFEKRVDDKIKILTDLKSEIEKDLKLIDNAEIKKIKSLSAIYGAMKPKEAALIFEGMDMSTLLSITNQMPEKKLALIIAALPPQRARELTLKLSQKGMELASIDKAQQKANG
ncbi:MAG: hypothetical protein HEEMFOPI_00026 [Holosporales bacterium]